MKSNATFYKQKHLGICDTQVLKFQFFIENVLFLRWHYPDQVLGFSVTPPHLSRPFYQLPIQLSIIEYYVFVFLSTSEYHSFQ